MINTGDESELTYAYDDFIEVYRKLPMPKIPIQYDLQEILSGQVVAGIYSYLNLLNASVKVHEVVASSFSSSEETQLKFVKCSLGEETVVRLHPSKNAQTKQTIK